MRGWRDARGEGLRGRSLRLRRVSRVKVLDECLLCSVFKWLGLEGSQGLGVRVGRASRMRD